MCLPEYGDDRTATRWGIAAGRLEEEARVTPFVVVIASGEGHAPAPRLRSSVAGPPTGGRAVVPLLLPALT
jgi:hypothetical protein